MLGHEEYLNFLQFHHFPKFLEILLPHPIGRVRLSHLLTQSRNFSEHLLWRTAVPETSGWRELLAIFLIFIYQPPF